MFGLSATEVYHGLPAWEVELLLLIARREHELDDDTEGHDDTGGPSRPPVIPKSRR